MLVWNRNQLGQADCAALPSSDAACDLVQGNVSALPKVLGTTLLRGGLIAAGLYVAGERAHLLRNSVAGALAIEVFVLGWALFKKST